MSCPNCGHSIQKISNEPARWIWWCLRCGTLIDESGASRSSEVPKLVERCRLFAKCDFMKCSVEQMWHRLGIAESIRPPEERKPL